MLQLAALPINKEVCALTSIDPQRLVSAIRVGRHREDVGIVESTTGPDGEANDAGLVCFNKSKLSVEPGKNVIKTEKRNATTHDLHRLAGSRVASASLRQECLSVAVLLEPGNQGLEDGGVVL